MKCIYGITTSKIIIWNIVKIGVSTVFKLMFKLSPHLNPSVRQNIIWARKALLMQPKAPPLCRSYKEASSRAAGFLFRIIFVWFICANCEGFLFDILSLTVILKKKSLSRFAASFKVKRFIEYSDMVNGFNMKTCGG